MVRASLAAWKLTHRQGSKPTSVQLCRTRTIGEFEGTLEPEMKFMERRGVLIA